jgi:hypothetical protein
MVRTGHVHVCGLAEARLLGCSDAAQPWRGFGPFNRKCTEQSANDLTAIAVIGVLLRQTCFAARRCRDSPVFNRESGLARDIYVGIAPPIERGSPLNVSTMDRRIRVIIVGPTLIAAWRSKFTIGRIPMATARDARSDTRTARFRQVCDGIGRELRGYYLPIATQPIPGEIKELLARLVALEAQTDRDRPGASLLGAGDQAEQPPRA